MSKKLATIIRDVDIDFDFESANVILPDIDRVVDFLKNMQFYSYIKNINEILTSFNPYINVSQSQVLEVKQ